MSYFWVNRLQEHAEAIRTRGRVEWSLHDDLKAAAAEIERLSNENVLLRKALAPFTELWIRKWQDKEDSVRTVLAGGFVSELQAISLADVIAARRALGLPVEYARHTTSTS